MEKQNYHLIGICGASMSGVALWLKKMGHNVSGSDISSNENINVLEQNGIHVQNNHEVNLIKNADVVVYSGAIINNKELAFARKENKVVLTRAQMLQIISKHYNKTIAIAGAHGKTTTTALIYSCLKYSRKNPTLHLGGVLVGEQCGLVFGDNEYFVTEACEYKDSFLSLSPYIGVILNIEKEHLDYFKSFNNIKKSFNKFANNSKNCIVYDKAKIEKTSKIKTFGYKNADFCVKNIKKIKNSGYKFDVYKQNQYYAKFELSVPGKHNIFNALAAIAVCEQLGIEKIDIYNGLKNFKGVKRRFEYISQSIIHDYAHHPTELKTTLKLLDERYKGKNVAIVFQPHTYSRTKTLMNDFVEVLKKCDSLYIFKTYSAREKYDRNASAKALYEEIKKDNSNVKYYATEKAINNVLAKKIEQDYVVVFLGAGNIVRVAENLAKTVDNAHRMC